MFKWGNKTIPLLTTEPAPATEAVQADVNPPDGSTIQSSSKPSPDQNPDDNTDTNVDVPEEPPPEEEPTKPKDLAPGQIYCDEGRQQWESRYNGLLAMVGFTVGLSNIWRFPYLCFHHGGGAFLIPYIFFLTFTAIPVTYLELIVGQFTQTGMISVWKLAPIFRGVGLCQVILPVLIAFYYNTILAWALLYCITSVMSSKLPWLGCDDPWNTLKCRDIPPDFEELDVKPDELRSGAEYFRGAVQRRWKSVHAGDFKENERAKNGKGTYGLGKDELGLGSPDWEMIAYLAAIYILILIFVRQGLRVRGKSAWISVIAPFIIMVVLIYRGVALPGAWLGLKFLFEPNGIKLLEVDTWVAAAEQALFSTGAGLGIHMTFASHNKFNNDILRDCLLANLIDVVSSLLCGIIVFIALGSIAASDNQEIEELVAQGPDLIFEMCTDALSRIPGANFFCFIFFLMILILGFESSLGALVCAIQSFFDVTGTWFDKYGQSRGIFINVIGIICFIVGLTCISRGGLHMFIFLDTYTANVPLLLCGLFLTVGLSWFWGLHEICNAAEAMTGRRPGIFFQICWKYISPILILIIMIITLDQETEAEYIEIQIKSEKSKTVVFDDNIQTAGHVYSHLPDILIPIGVIWYLLTSRGKTFKQKLLLGISPDYEHDEIIATGEAKRAKWAHYGYFIDCLKIPRFSLRRTLKVGPETTVEVPETGPNATNELMDGIDEAGVASGEIKRNTKDFMDDIKSPAGSLKDNLLTDVITKTDAQNDQSKRQSV